MTPAEPPIVLDVSRLDRLRRENADDPGLVDELLTIFLEQSPPLVAAIAAHAERGELALAGRVAHRLAGSARTLGVLAFAEACARLEELARAGTATGFAGDATAVADAFAAARTAIAAYRR